MSALHIWSSNSDNIKLEQFEPYFAVEKVETEAVIFDKIPN
jgi:hypothetical protein